MGLFGFGKSKEEKKREEAEQKLRLKEEAEKHLDGVILHAKEEIEKVGLGDQKARVALVLDISGSMRHLFNNGTVDAVVERALALGVNFDDNQAVDVFLFGVKAHDIGEVTKGEFFEFVDREVQRKYDLEGGTNYAPVIEMVTKKYTSEKGDPAYVMFVTDGDNGDKRQATAAITEAAKHGIFWQFIGIGGASFSYLETLDTMEGRVIDNANFFDVNDIKSIDDNELYRRMLVEFPSWLKESAEKGIR